MDSDSSSSRAALGRVVDLRACSVVEKRGPSVRCDCLLSLTIVLY